MARTNGKRAKFGRDDLYAALSPRGRLHLLAAIFFTFAAIGVLLQLMRIDGGDPWWGVALWAAFSGAIAVGWAMSFMWRMWLLPVVILAQFGLPMLLGAFIGNRWTVEGRLAVLAAGAVVLIVLGYVLFAVFIDREGTQRLRLQTEIEVAQRIHQSLVPPIDRSTGRLEVLARSDASAEMGGDLLDIVERDGWIDLYVADVSGHGVGAGMVMAMLKSAIRMRLLAPGGLDTLVHDLNNVVENLTEPQMFATFVCLRFDPDGRAFEFALAGHLPILHWDAATGAVRELPNDHLPLGVLPDEPYRARASGAGPGDVLAVFTDGLTEAMDPAGRQFGHRRIGAILAEHARRPLAEIHSAIMGAARAHGPQRDDQTLLLARIC